MSISPRILFTSKGAPAPITRACRVYHNANQSIPSASWTVLAFNSERYDTDTMHDTATNNSRITFKKAGKYRVGANAQFTSNATGYRGMLIRKNGSAIIALKSTPPVSGAATMMNLNTEYHFALNDYVEVMVIQTSGVSLNIEYNAESSPEFWASRFGD